MSHNVYFSSLSNSKMVSPLNKIKELSNKCNAKKMFEKNDLVAIKVHFGEQTFVHWSQPDWLSVADYNIKTIKTPICNQDPFITIPLFIEEVSIIPTLNLVSVVTLDKYDF